MAKYQIQDFQYNKNPFSKLIYLSKEQTSNKEKLEDDFNNKLIKNKVSKKNILKFKDVGNIVVIAAFALGTILGGTAITQGAKNVTVIDWEKILEKEISLINNISSPEMKMQKKVSLNRKLKNNINKLGSKIVIDKNCILYNEDKIIIDQTKTLLKSIN